MVVLLQDGHELEGCEGAAHLKLRDVAVKAAEDARVIAADVEDLVALQALVAVEGLGQQLHGGQDIDVSGRMEMARWSSTCEMAGQYDRPARIRSYPSD